MKDQNMYDLVRSIYIAAVGTYIGEKEPAFARSMATLILEDAKVAARIWMIDSFNGTEMEIPKIIGQAMREAQKTMAQPHESIIPAEVIND